MTSTTLFVIRILPPNRPVTVPDIVYVCGVGATGGGGGAGDGGGAGGAGGAGSAGGASSAGGAGDTGALPPPPPQLASIKHNKDPNIIFAGLVLTRILFDAVASA